ncbi:MAG: protein kinase [Pirellulaceae bacterium]|nr:protein kinase [Pirellulaceae bacterium]
MIPEDRTEKLSDDSSPVDLYATELIDNNPSFGSLGQYRLLGQLGRGGMGIVYEAEPIQGGSRVALKTLQSSSADALSQLKAEFRVVADLAHPNLVQLGELDTTDRIPFFTMEIVRGLAFNEYVQSSFESMAASPNLPYNEDRLRRALSQFADGLAALHGAGLIHRDIKPSNVLVTHEGRVVILDLGLAVVTDHSKYRNSQKILAGTPYYMAPEQARGESITPACDWYSVGVMLFELLTGERLFQARSFDDLLRQKMQVNRPSPHDVVSSIPQDLNDLCCQLLQPNPIDRPKAENILSILRANEKTSLDSSVWIGRENELNILHQACRDVLEGATRVVLVSGFSGVGKSALIDHFLSILRRQAPIVVLRGRCYENESVAYRGFDSVVDALATYLRGLPKGDVERVLPLDIELLCQLFPVLSDVAHRAGQHLRATNRLGDPREQKQKGILALRELLSRLARYVAIVIYIDDLQQGDIDTAAIFRELLRANEAPNLIFLATYRSEDAEINTCLKLVRRLNLPLAEQNELTEQVELSIDRLSREESLLLSSSLLTGYGITSSDTAGRIAEESQGDPLFIRMLVEHLVQHRKSGNASTIEKSHWTLKSVIENRIDSLETHERKAIEVLAAAGRPVEERDLEMIASLDSPSIGIIRSLRIKKLIRRLGDLQHIETFHDKIRETVLDGLSQNRLAEHCLSLAHQMDRGKDDSPIEFLADLYRRGGERARAGECYESAASIAVSTFAFRRAAEYYQFALDLLQLNPARELSLRTGLADALANASRSSEAAKEYLAAASLADSDERLRLQQLASLRYLTSGHVTEGIDSLRNLLDRYRLPWPKNRTMTVIGLLVRNAYLRLRGLRLKSFNSDRKPTSDTEAKIEVCWSAAAGLSLVDPLRGSFYIAETLCRSLRAHSTTTVPRDLAAYMGQIAIAGSKSRKATRRVLIASREMATTRREPYVRAMQSIARGVAALLRGQWSSALKSCDAAILWLEDESCHGATWELTTAQTCALWSLQYQGNIVELSHRQPDLLRVAKDSNDLFAMLNYGTQVMAHIELARDCPSESHRRLDEDRDKLSDRGFFVQNHNYILARTYTFLYEGRSMDALATIDGQWQNYRREFLSFVQQVRIDHRQVALRAMMAAAEQNVDSIKLLSRARHEIKLIRSEHAPWGTALAMVFDAGCDQIEMKSKQALEKLRLAIPLLDKARMGLFQTAAIHHLSKLQGVDQSASNTRWAEHTIANSDRMASMLIPGFAKIEK